MDDLRVRAASEGDRPTVKALRDAFCCEFPPPAWHDESWETRSRGAAYVHLTANLEALPFYDRLAFGEESRNLVGDVESLLSRES